MIGINKCLSVKVCILLTWLQSFWKPIEVYIRDGSGQEIWFLGRSESFAGTYVMSFQVGIGSLGGTVFFQVGLCTPLRTMPCKTNFNESIKNLEHNQVNLSLCLWLWFVCRWEMCKWKVRKNYLLFCFFINLNFIF